MITRRRFLRAGSMFVTGAIVSPPFSLRGEAVRPQLVVPTPAQRAWQDCEVGVLYSFDLAVAAGDRAENNSTRKTWDPGLYHPTKLDTDQWIDAAKAAGAGYAVFTATHFNGFMQWQSDLYPYGLKQI